MSRRWQSCTYSSPREGGLSTSLGVRASFALGVLLLVGCSDARSAAREHELRMEFLNPTFSEDFVQYWQIDLGCYRRRLVQEYFLADSETMHRAFGTSVEELVRSQRRWMINWLEEQLLWRESMWVEFRDLPDPRGGYRALGQDPLDEDKMKAELGSTTKMYALYQEWAARAEAGLRSP